jgi:hypothetical protein
VMFKELLKNLQILVARMRVERPVITIFPKFKSTLFILWLVTIFGLCYGRLFSSSPGAQNVSILITLIAWAASVAIILLENPAQRLKRLLYQMLAILLLLTLLVAVSITYYLLFLVTSAAVSVKLTWVIGSILLGALTFFTLFQSFIHPINSTEQPYPGMRTAPLLFLVLASNFIAWFWQRIVDFFF